MSVPILTKHDIEAMGAFNDEHEIMLLALRIPVLSDKFIQIERSEAMALIEHILDVLILPIDRKPGPQRIVSYREQQMLKDYVAQANAKE